MFSMLLFIFWCYCFIALIALLAEYAGAFAALIWVPLRKIMHLAGTRANPNTEAEASIMREARYAQRLRQMDSILGIRAKH